MKAINRFKKALSYNWYTQGFNAVPLFLNHAAHRGVNLKKLLGFSYSKFLLHFKDGYCEFGYLEQDFKKIWKQIKFRVKNEPAYLKKIKKQYEKIFSRNSKIFLAIDRTNIHGLSSPLLLDLLKKTGRALVEAVGSGHIVEAIAIEAEKELKNILLHKLSDSQQLNNYFTVLCTPSQSSFLKQEEKALEKLKHLSVFKKARALQQHAKKYSWIHNSYCGPKKLTAAYFNRRLKVLNQPASLRAFAKKTALIKKLRLNFEERKLINLIDFTFKWQDDRKRNILIAINYLGRIIQAISKKIKVPLSLLNYLGEKDVMNLKSLNEIKLKVSVLKQRQKGVLFLIRENEEIASTKGEYQLSKKIYSKPVAKVRTKNMLIQGTPANYGKAKGRVKICIGLSSIKKVKTGNVIVASMTRPEFMPALKKCAAIVTDEGGITCHAAIVSRELGIPCIIGTKIATKIFKDGDLVEVNANHGIVKIINCNP